MQWRANARQTLGPARQLGGGGGWGGSLLGEDGSKAKGQVGGHGSEETHPAEAELSCGCQRYPSLHGFSGVKNICNGVVASVGPPTSCLNTLRRDMLMLHMNMVASASSTPKLGHPCLPDSTTIFHWLYTQRIAKTIDAIICSPPWAFCVLKLTALAPFLLGNLNAAFKWNDSSSFLNIPLGELCAKVSCQMDTQPTVRSRCRDWGMPCELHGPAFVCHRIGPQPCYAMIVHGHAKIIRWLRPETNDGQPCSRPQDTPSNALPYRHYWLDCRTA